MITSDYHVHSIFSTDSDAPLESIINKAVFLGLERLCITDHMDREYPAPEFDLELDDYVEAILLLKEKYKDKIKLLLGIEIGLRNEPEIKDRIKDYYKDMLSNYKFDFVIGSTHVLENEDPYYKTFWNNRTTRQVMENYFKSISDNVKFYSPFQVYGHLDYIIRYIPDETKDYSPGDYSDLIDSTLKELISHGTGIELNTSGYRYGLPLPHPKKEILMRYRELGGEILTVGSDAHKAADLCFEFKKAEELLLSLGYQYYTVFENQKPEFIKL